MKMQYDKHALLEFLERIQSMSFVLKSKQDESLLYFDACKQVYMRLLGEIDQICRKAYNRVEDAESMQRSAESVLQTQQRILENAESDLAKASAETKIRLASRQLTDARTEVELANTKYFNAKSVQSKISALWEKYLPLFESASRRAEDRFFEFHTVIKKEHQALSRYIAAMQQVEEILNNGENVTKEAWRSGEDKPSKENEGSLEKPTINGSKSSTLELETNDRNTIGLATTAGSTHIVMHLGGEEYFFANTKSGAAKAYRTAMKFGDDELASQAHTFFLSFDSKSNITLEQQYVADTIAELQAGLPNSIDKEMVMAGAEIRKMRTPVEGTRGRWQDTVFYLDDTFVPPKYNSEHLTVGEIKHQLNELYGIQVEGIPFTNGVADFSSVSIANVSTADIVMRKKGISQSDYDSLEPLDKTKLLDEVFTTKRTDNFDLADEIVAERQIPIPGLSPGYDADDLKEWREKGKVKFSWDEQINGGYNLIPSVIHESIAHTGLVKSTSRAVEYFEKRENDSPEKYSWDESEAPISIAEFLKKCST